MWYRLAQHNPLWAAFQQCTERPTGVVALEPHSSAAQEAEATDY